MNQFSKHYVYEHLFPLAKIKKSRWYRQWLEEERLSFVRSAKIFFLPAGLIFVWHYFFYDIPEGLAPSALFASFRFGMGAFCVSMFILYSFPAVARSRLYKWPAFLASIIICFFQALITVYSDGKMPTLYSFIFVVIAVNLLRLTPMQGIGYFLFVIALDVPSFLQIGLSPAFIASSSVTALFFVVFTRAHMIESIDHFLSDKELAAAKAEAARIQVGLTREMARMTAQVAHDIRSPLSALHILLNDLSGLPAENQNLARLTIKRVQAVAEDLLQIHRVNLETSKLKEEAASEDEIRPIDISSVLKQCVQEKFVEFTFSRNIEIQDLVPIGLNGFVGLSSIQLSRIISNLLNNSLAATKSGTVRVSAREKNNTFSIIVSDTGTGIAKDRLAQVGQYGVSFTNGNGLGLHHARTSVIAAGGTLKMFSKAEFGTLVAIILPKQSSKNDELN